MIMQDLGVSTDPLEAIRDLLDECGLLSGQCNQPGIWRRWVFGFDAAVGSHRNLRKSTTLSEPALRAAAVLAIVREQKPTESATASMDAYSMMSC